MLVTKEDVDMAIEHPLLYGAAELAHVAWCEQLDRQSPGWGARYLVDFVGNPRAINRNSTAVRVRVASVLAVVRAVKCSPNDMVLCENKPIVTLEEIEGNLLNPYLLELMQIANDAWDDEAFRKQPLLRREEKSFKEKYRKLRNGNDPRYLFAASQLAVLKCTPTIEVGEKYVIKRVVRDGRRRVLPTA